MSASAWTARDGGLDIAVRVTPRGGRAALGPGTDTYFAGRVAAPPVDGAANAALVVLVAEVFGVAKHAVSVIAGETSRLKRLRIAGDPAALASVATRMYEGKP